MCLVFTAYGSDPFVVGLTQTRGGTLELLMTDIPDLAPMIAFGASIDSSDHSSLSVVVSMDQTVPNMRQEESFP